MDKYGNKHVKEGYNICMLHLKELFDHRDKVFREETLQILDALKPTVTDGVCKFFHIHDDQLKWQDVRFGLHPNTGGSVIVLAGLIDYRAGDDIYDEASGQFIPIEQPTTSMVKIMLPEQVVENADSNTIASFLKKIFDKTAETHQEQIEPDPQLDPSSSLSDTTLALAQLGFDTSTLNSQQIANILSISADKRTLH